MWKIKKVNPLKFLKKIKVQLTKPRYTDINFLSVGIFEILNYLGVEFFYVGVSIFGSIREMFDLFSLKEVQLIKYAI